MTLSAWNKLQHKLIRAVFKLSVRIGRSRYHAIEIGELNQFLTHHLPIKHTFSVPVGSGELDIQRAHFSLKKNKLIIKAHCDLIVKSMNMSLYQASITITISGQLAFSDNNLYIRIANPRLKAVELENDRYPITHTTTNWISAVFNRNPATSVISGVEQTLNFLSGQTYDEAKRYLSLYINGNKQKVLDYHRGDIQESIEEMLTYPSNWYRLDPDNFEENLLIEYGRTIRVEQGQIRVYWN